MRDKQLHKLNNKEKREKLMAEKGIDWNQFSENEKHGTFVRRTLKERYLSQDELDEIPEALRPEGAVSRSEEVTLEVPPLLDIINSSTSDNFQVDMTVRQSSEHGEIYDSLR